MKKIIGYFLIFISIIVVLFVLYKNSNYTKKQQTFSTYTVLASTWDKYKAQFINNDGRVVDNSQGGITTSEGQSYALLRAVWTGDNAEFDKVWTFTEQNLKRPDDNLFGWRWGKKPDGSYGFIGKGDQNSAADADTDIALALILASRRFHNDEYKSNAQKILTDMWRDETAVVNGKRYLIAGNWASNSQEIIVNPSYFAPYAWRVFAEVDSDHDWDSLVDPAYTLLNEVGQSPLDKGKGVGLPPDWVAIERIDGSLKASTISGLSTNYGFDAMRVPFRVALDWEWFHDLQAKDYLSKSYTFLVDDFKKRDKLSSTYAHDGSIVNDNESPSMYATSLGFFMLADPTDAKTIYQQKVIKLYSNDTNSFVNSVQYYDQNWLWFGAALYNHQLILYH